VKDWVTLSYFKLKGTSCKTYLYYFVDESSIDMIIEGLNTGNIGVMIIIHKHRLCRDLCENYIAHCLLVWIFFGLEQWFSTFFMQWPILQPNSS